MNFSNLDLFSQQFYFNLKNSQIRKGTLLDIKLIQQSELQNQQPQHTVATQNQNSQNQSDEECDENQIQDEIENQLERFKNRLPSIPFQQKQLLDQKCKTPKIELLKADDQSISTLDQQSINIQHNTHLQQQQLQQSDGNETIFYQKESFENCKNQSNFKIINKKPIKLKKQRSQKLNLTFSEPPELKLHASTPPKQISAFNNSQFLNTHQSNIRQNHFIQLNTSNMPTILNERNIANEETKDFRKTLQKLQVSKNSSISTKINKFLFGCRCWRPKKITQNFNSKQLQKIETQIDKELDIFRIYKDILFLKKAVYIVLSQDQLAALQLMGCSSNFLDQDLSLLAKNFNQQDHNLNYYEQQLAISLSDELQCQFSQKFLEKCQNNKYNLDKMDLRILQSIQKDSII
ncbi:hypothetical protein ABPG73_009346 [Tetrahymena malaccensis]